MPLSLSLSTGKSVTKDHGYLNVSTSPEVDTLLLNVSSEADTLQPKPATSAKERAETRPPRPKRKQLARKAECSCCRASTTSPRTSPRVNRSILRGGRQQNIDPGEFEKIYSRSSYLWPLLPIFDHPIWAVFCNKYRKMQVFCILWIFFDFSKSKNVDFFEIFWKFVEKFSKSMFFRNFFDFKKSKKIQRMKKACIFWYLLKKRAQIGWSKIGRSGQR